MRNTTVVLKGEDSALNTSDFSKAQGHWILARMGKKVLRPGGKELTRKLIETLDISVEDDVVEFAPGLGFTASLALANNPRSYVGVEADAYAVRLLQQRIKGNNIHFIRGNASMTSLTAGSKDKVWGEAMLTMQADHRKTEIVREAHRILKKGGLYAIHELGLFPDGLNEELKATIQKDLALSIRVNARPLTAEEWKILLENEGFKIIKTETNPMRLLEPTRMIDDEGIFGVLKIVFNILTHLKAGKRILQMRRTFRKHQEHINAVAIVAEKI